MILNQDSLTLEEAVYVQLEEEILSGKLLPGEQLREVALSKRLSVSRTPIRGALHRLKEEGLIELAANKGATVVGITEADLSDAYLIRTRLDGLASSMAAERISDEDKEKLRESVELSEFYINKDNPEQIKELDTKFHKIIYRASGNRVLCKILTDLHRSIKVYRKISFATPGRAEKSVMEHREILDAILRGDADEADRLTCLHVNHAMENLFGRFDVKKE
jgi:DNA-binding GntR family transcriptional regulator